MKRLNILYYGFLTCLMYGLVLSIPISIFVVGGGGGRLFLSLPTLFILLLQFFFKPAFLDKVTDKSLISKLEMFFVVLLFLLTIAMAFLFNISIGLTSDDRIERVAEGLTGSVGFISVITLLIWTVSRITSTKTYNNN